MNNASSVDSSDQDNIVNNGVVQPVDTVLMPPEKYLSAITLAQVLIKDDDKFKDIFLAFMMAEMINLLERKYASTPVWVCINTKTRRLTSVASI